MAHDSLRDSGTNRPTDQLAVLPGVVAVTLLHQPENGLTGEPWELGLYAHDGIEPERVAAHWREHSTQSLEQAGRRAARGDVAGVRGHLRRAFVEAAHA